MQPRKLLPAAAPVAPVLPVAAALDDAVDADDEVLDDEGALDELLPHAAISKLAAAAAAVVINPVFLTVSSPRPGVPPPRHGGPLLTQVGGRLILGRPRWEDILRVFSHVVAELRSSGHVRAVHVRQIDVFLQKCTLVRLSEKMHLTYLYVFDRKY